MNPRFSFRYEELSVADFYQENTSNDNKCIQKQNILCDESKTRSFLPAKKRCFLDTQQKSSLTSDGNLNNSSDKETESEDKIPWWSEKFEKMVERQGFPNHLFPIKSVSKIDVGEVSRIPPRSTFTQSIERKVNRHLAEEFEKLNCVGRKRLQRKVSSSKQNAKSLLAKRKQVHCAKAEHPEFQGSNLNILSQAKEDLELEKNRSKETSKSNHHIPNSDINKTDVPNWKRYLDNMKVPNFPERKTLRGSASLEAMNETEMEFAETAPAVEHIECNKLKIDHASPTVDEVDSSGDETGYESELQTPENELSLFQEMVNHQASLKSNPITPPEMNSSKSCQMVGNTKTTAPLLIEECFQVLKNTNVLNKLDNFNKNSSFYSADMRFPSSYENSASVLKFPESSPSFCKVPDYSKPGCSKDADYMGALNNANFESNMPSTNDICRRSDDFLTLYKKFKTDKKRKWQK